jgi:hypothetical protein
VPSDETFAGVERQFGSPSSAPRRRAAADRCALERPLSALVGEPPEVRPVDVVQCGLVVVQGWEKAPTVRTTDSISAMGDVTAAV